MFQFEDDKIYNMPPFFGGSEYNPEALAIAEDFIQMQFTQVTDSAKLEKFLPEKFTLLRPELTIAYTQLRSVQFMNGSGYNLIRVSIPARFVGDTDNETGSFILVIWENNTIPIIGGREETGMPKIFADITDIHNFFENYSATASFDGNTFLRLEMNELNLVKEEELTAFQNDNQEDKAFGWRYIPNVGGPGAALNEPILYPSYIQTVGAWRGQGTVNWTMQTHRQNARQAHIINALANLPVYESLQPLMTQGSIAMRPAMAKVLK